MIRGEMRTIKIRLIIYTATLTTGRTQLGKSLEICSLAASRTSNSSFKDDLRFDLDMIILRITTKVTCKSLNGPWQNERFFDFVLTLAHPTEAPRLLSGAAICWDARWKKHLTEPLTGLWACTELPQLPE